MSETGKPPSAPTEAEQLIAVLERNRRTFAWKTSGLDESGLSVTTAASSMTLGGLGKHVALVEVDWLAVKLAGREYGPPWDAVDFDADPDWEWRTAAEDTPERLHALWEESAARSRANLALALAGGDPGAAARFTWPDGRTPSIRRLLVDMIEEYARHTGNADLLRESIDGLVGEDPPRP